MAVDWNLESAMSGFGLHVVEPLPIECASRTVLDLYGTLKEACLCVTTGGFASLV